MDILIKGMEMPKDGRLVLAICPNGHVYKYYGDRHIPRGYAGYGIEAKQEALIKSDVVAIPPHGRLIDADVFKEKVGLLDDFECQELVQVGHILDEAPTVIPASDGE